MLKLYLKLHPKTRLRQEKIAEQKRKLAEKKYLTEQYKDIPKVPIFIINLEGSDTRLNNMRDRLDNKSHLYGRACRVPAVDFRNCTDKFQYVHAPFWEKTSRGGLLASGMSHRRFVCFFDVF